MISAVTTVTKMEVRSETTEVILNITLDIIHLLTGEDYTVVKKKSGECATSSSRSSISGVGSRAQKPIMEETPLQSVIHEEKNNEKILELANKIIELLTGEVPVRCQDVSVYFSMKEWEYLEGHKDLYKDVMMENHQNLTPAGPLCDNLSTQEHVSFSFSHSNHFSWSYLGNELKKTTKDVTICEGESLKDVSNCAHTDQAQFPSTPCNGGTVTDPNIYTPTDGDKQGQSPHIVEEPDLTESNNNNTPSDPVQHHPFLCIKEEPVSCDEDLSEPNSYTPTDYLRYPSPHIKEEPVSCDEDLSEPNSYTPTDLQYPSPHIKEELVSCDEDLSEPISYILTDLQYPSPHIKEEPGSCDEDLSEPISYTLTDHLQNLSYFKQEPISSLDFNRDIPTNYTQEHYYTYSKIKPNSHIGGNITHSDMYRPKDHAQYKSTNVKEDPVSCHSRNITYPDSYTLPDHIQRHPTTRIKEEPISPDVRDFTDPNRYHTQYQSTHIKEEPVSCQDSAKYPFAQSQKKPIPSDLYTSTNPTKTFPSTCVKDEIAESHLPTSGSTDVKTDNSSSPMKVIVLAHLVDVDPIVANTSHRVKYMKDARLSLRNRASLLNTPEAGHTFGDISNLTKYARIHSRKRTLQCSDCGQYFLRKLQLEAHLRMHLKQTSFQCVECGQYFVRKLQLEAHILIMHAKQPSYQCADCGKYFLDNVQLLDRKKYPGETKYKCPGCRKSLDNEQNHLIRERNLKVEKPFQCPECGKCYSIYYELFLHKKTHMK